MNGETVFDSRFFKLMSSVLGAIDKECGQKIKVGVRVRVRLRFSSTRLNQRPIQPVAAAQDLWLQ